MVSPIARIGDKGSHGGEIITGSPNWTCNHSPIARVGDTYACPIHGANPIVTGSPDWKCNGSPIARVGSETQCGAMIISGSPTRNVS